MTYKKRALAMLLAAALAASLAGCGAGKGESLYDHGLDVVDLVAELAGSEKYMELTYGGNDGVLELVTSAAKGRHSRPEAVYKITVDARDLLETAIRESDSDLELEDFAPQIRDFVDQRLYAVMFTQINSAQGYESVVAASACTASKLFVCDELEENMIYLYCFEDAVPIAVVFTKGEDGAVSASGMPVFSEELRESSSRSAVRKLLDDFDPEIEEVGP